VKADTQTGVFWLLSDYATDNKQTFSHRNHTVSKALPEIGAEVRYYLEYDRDDRLRAVVVTLASEPAPNEKPALCPRSDQVWKDTGVVTDWNDEKGYGRITPRGRGLYMIYLHHSAIRDGVRPNNGAEVEFEAEMQERGEKGKNWRASHVIVLNPDPAVQRQTMQARRGFIPPVQQQERRIEPGRNHRRPEPEPAAIESKNRRRREGPSKWRDTYEEKWT